MADVSWHALESNPESINSFLGRLGVSGVECVDVFSFDEDALAWVPTPQLAMLLCFPSDEAKEYMQGEYEKMKLGEEPKPEDVFFMTQKIENACGTFALFHSLANMRDKIDIGNGSFRKWLETAKDVPEDERSDLLFNNSELAEAHADAAAAGETDQPDQVEYHFIAYVVKDGILYEIDSCAPGARALGPSSETTLVRDAGVAVMRIADHVQNLSFAAMALIAK